MWIGRCRAKIVGMTLGRLAVPVFTFMLAAQTPAEKGRPMTPEERTFLIGQLEKSRNLLQASTRGLTAAQANYKAGPERWSILECVEHVTLTESFLFGFVQQLLKSPVKPVKDEEQLKAGDEKVLKNITDRSQKATAPEQARPASKYTNLTAALEAFGEARTKTIEYAQTTQDDLRSHSFQMGPGEPMDDYQLMLMMAAHTERHTAQINEVKAAPGYPK
jgi:hypothetical protein